jgi:3-methyladenine DNA glycosylase AlkD
MPSKRQSARAKVPGKGKQRPLEEEVETALAALKRLGNKKTRDAMAPRYGIVTDKAFGVPMATMQKLARNLGRNHELAAALWKTGWYEARMVACMVDEPHRVTPAQMDRWCRDFDNWAICDTLCFHLFDRTPHAWAKVKQWSSLRGEFAKRASFALKSAADSPMVRPSHACVSRS